MIPFWVRRLCRRLDELKIVYRYKCHQDRIEVWYKTRMKRNYVFKKSYKDYQYALEINQKQSLLESTIPIGIQFQWYPLNPNQKTNLEPYFMVTRRTLNASSVMQKEILVHELLYKLIRIGWIPCLYSFSEIQDELNIIEDYDKVFTNTMYDTCRRRMGRAVIESYFNIAEMPRQKDRKNSTLKHAFSEHKILYIALQYLIKNTRGNANITGLINALYSKGFGPVWINPALYITLFEQLKYDHTRMFFDPSPWVGSKLIACSLIGAKYAPEKMETINYAINRGLEESIDIDLLPFNDQADIMLIDNNFQRMVMADIDKYMNTKWNNAILFVKSDQAKEVRKKYPPTRILKIKTAVNKSYDYLFTYDDSNIL